MAQIAQMAKATPESMNIRNYALLEVKYTKALQRYKRQTCPCAQQPCLGPRVANTLPRDLRISPQAPERPLALPSRMLALGKPRTAHASAPPHAPARHLAHSPGGKARPQDKRSSMDTAAGRGSGGEHFDLCCRRTVQAHRRSTRSSK